MIYYRYENLDQMFGLGRGECGILPLNVFAKHPELAKKYGKQLLCEIPPEIYPGDEEKVFSELSGLKAAGLTDVYCENLGAFFFARELGLKIHGGMFLNITNSASFAEYEKLGASSLVCSFETELSKIRQIQHKVPLGVLAYGYIPAMRMRVCPLRGKEGCGKCNAKRSLVDRTGRKFKVLCKEKAESWVLNSVPLYAGDKGIDFADDKLFYFTVENKNDAKAIADIYKNGETPKFARTAGLYFRELL